MWSVGVLFKTLFMTSKGTICIICIVFFFFACILMGCFFPDYYKVLSTERFSYQRIVSLRWDSGSNLLMGLHSHVKGVRWEDFVSTCNGSCDACCNVPYSLKQLEGGAASASSFPPVPTGIFFFSDFMNTSFTGQSTYCFSLTFLFYFRTPSHNGIAI